MLVYSKFFTRKFLVVGIFTLQFIMALMKKLFGLWVCFEVKMFITLSFLYMVTSQSAHTQNTKFVVVIWYFIVQVLSGFLMFFGFLSKKLLFFMLLGLLMKMGFFPIAHWGVFLYSCLGWLDIFILGYLSKVGPLLVFCSFARFGAFGESLILLMLLVFLVSLLGIFVQLENLKVMIGWSSLSKMVLMFLLSVFDSSASLTMFVLYGLVFYLFCKFCSQYNLIALGDLKKYQNLIYVVVVFSLFLLWMLGLPPFFIFWVKVIFFMKILITVEWFFLVFFIGFLFLQILIYSKIVGCIWKKIQFLSSVNKLKSSRLIYVLFILGLSFFFVFF